MMVARVRRDRLGVVREPFAQLAHPRGEGPAGVVLAVPLAEVDLVEEGLYVGRLEHPVERAVRLPPQHDIAEVEHDGGQAHTSSSGSRCTLTLPGSLRALRTD